MMKILNLAIEGVYLVCSIKACISSSPRLLAASISIMSICLPSSAARQCLQVPHGVSLGPCSQTKAREKILALEVFPLPLSPEKR